MDESIRERIDNALKGTAGQYVEVHVEESSSSQIRYRGSELEEIGRSNGLGGNVRALAGGGWGFASFNDLSDLEAKVEQAVSQARLVGGEPVYLAETPTVVDSVPALVGMDPTHLSLAQKKSVLDSYVDILMGTSGVQSASVGYTDSKRRMIYANSEGSFIDQERVDVNLRLSAMARSHGDVQQYGISLGSLGDFTFVQDVVDATIAASKVGRPGNIYNIGGGSPVTLSQSLDLISACIGQSLDIKYETTQRGDMRDTYADITRARQDLNYKPVVSLADGIQAEYQWISNTKVVS